MWWRQRTAAGWLVGWALASAAACGGTGPRPVYGVVDRGADTDEDGAADVDDACPSDPEDGRPPKANDGCPASDWDGDGVLLADDRCPNAKEDGEEPAPRDGCPVRDADEDGVADSLDRCPTQSEDNELPLPSDGCPSPDSDRDGIADGRDRCPSEAETWNGWRDADGCPDSATSEVAFDPDSSTVFVPASKRIDFEFDEAELTAAARAVVAEVARVLKAQPEIDRVEIEGHASSKGEAGYNQSLTERRAVAVAKALVQEGVEAKRLVPVGYGEYCPAVETADDVDEPRNRRVALQAVRVNGVWRDVPRGCWRAQSHGIDPSKRQGGGWNTGSQVKVSGGA